MKSEKAAIKRLTDIKSEVSSHYLIKNNGEILLWFQIYILHGMQEIFMEKLSIFK